MQKYLISLDLDDTLLNNQGQISNFNKNILHKLDQLGHILLINTGRPYRLTKSAYEQLELNILMSICNGAGLIKNGDVNQALYCASIDKKIVQDLFRKQDELGIEFMTAECLSKAYSSGNVSQAYDDKTRNFFINDNPNQISAINENPLEVTIQFKPKQHDLIKQYLSKYDQLGFYHWDCDNIAELTLNGTNKCIGINKLLNKCYQGQSSYGF